MTKVDCVICNKTFELNIDQARSDYKEKFGSDIKDEVILCTGCYEKLMSDALGNTSSIEN